METFRDQVADRSKSLDPRRRNREVHCGPIESVERRGHSKRQNADECGRMSPTCASQCRRHPAALICVLPFTVTSSFHGLAWPAVHAWACCTCPRMHMSARYDGAVQRWNLLTNEHNLNWMRWRTGSQCRSPRRLCSRRCSTFDVWDVPVGAVGRGVGSGRRRRSTGGGRD